MQVDIVFLVTGLIFLIPTTIAVRYYLLIRTREYFLSFCLFLSLSLNALIIAFYGVNNFGETITVQIAIILVLVITKRTLSQAYNKIFYTFLTSVVVLSITNVILLFQTPTMITLQRFIIFETIRVLTGIYVIFAYSKMKLLIENQRTLRVTNLWRLAGAIIVLTGIYRLMDVLLYLIMNQGEMLVVFPAQLQDSFLIVSISAGLTALITSILAIFFPELFLLSKYQVNGVDELYKLAETLGERAAFPLVSQDYFIGYLESVNKVVSSLESHHDASSNEETEEDT